MPDYDYTLLLLILARITGCVFFNPIFGRRNVPPLVRMGLALMLSVFAYDYVENPPPAAASPLELGIDIMIQLTVGYMIGFVMQIFVAAVLAGGEATDAQIGITMANIYDPQSNVSMNITASMFNALYMLLFFATGSHQTLLKVFVRSASLIPYGGPIFDKNLFGDLAGMLSLVFLYAVKLCLPLMAAEFIAEFGVGLIMKAVPQLDVFVIHIQLKILIGFGMVLLLVPAFSAFLNAAMDTMFDRMSRLVSGLAG